LPQAELIHTVLDGAQLQGVDFRGALFSGTILARCNDLALALRLDEIRHLGASSLDTATLRASAGRLSDVFLKGAGWSTKEIEAYRRLYSSRSA
jgi:uncharacterized protein YjbI with pentapeptide repeats